MQKQVSNNLTSELRQVSGARGARAANYFTLIMEEEDIDLNLIQRQFLCCTPMKKFNWNNSDNRTIRLDAMSPETQRQILDKTVNHVLVKKYPIKQSYQRAFLKLLINELEKNSQEIDDELYSAYCSLVSSDDRQSSTQYRHFLYENNASTDSITLQESINIVSFGTTGLCTWQAGLGLAEWCMTNKQLIDGKKVIELGCGVGLTGLAIIRACAPGEYVFSDSHPSVINMLCRNILINLKSDDERGSNLASNDLNLRYNGVNVKAMRLPWEDINDSSETTNSIPDSDVVLAADVLYDDSCFDSLASALHHLLRRSGTYAVIAATVRNADTIAQFLKILGSYDLVFEEARLPQRKFFIHTDDTPIRIMKIVNSTS